MADVLAAAIALRNSTPIGDARLFRSRQDHVLWLRSLEKKD